MPPMETDKALTLKDISTWVIATMIIGSQNRFRATCGGTTWPVSCACIGDLTCILQIVRGETDATTVRNTVDVGRHSRTAEQSGSNEQTCPTLALVAGHRLEPASANLYRYRRS